MPGARYPIEMVWGVPVVAAPQEIDVSNADCLRTVLLEAACRGRGTFVVDMTRTRLCATAGLNVLVRAHKRALAEGGELRLVTPAGPLQRVLAVTGLDRLIPTFTGRDQALKLAAAAGLPPRRPRRPPGANRPPAGPAPAPSRP